MLHKQNKENALFEYTNKILATEQAHFIEPFPRNIHQLLTLYLQLCYFICFVPYRLVYNSTSCLYETKSNSIQLVIYTILWVGSLVEYTGSLIKHIIETKPGDPISILLLLGGIGHLTSLNIYVTTTIWFRDDIKDLINCFLSYSSPPNETPTSNSFSHYYTTSNDKMGTNHYTSLSGNQLGSILQKVFTFKRIALVWWLLTLVAGVKSTAIINKIINGTPLVETVNTSDIYGFIKYMVPNLDEILNPSSFFSHFVHVILNIINVIAYMQKFWGVFIYGLEIMIALTMKMISYHFTSSLMATRDYWKQSSSNVLSSFLIVRQSYRTINKIFGWLFFYSIMGEFPNFTFSTVFRYQKPDEIMQWQYKFGMMYALLLVIIASLAVIELSKLKEWIHFEDKRNWSLSKADSLQRRIVLFELSLNRYALYAHGLFQLSLPAFISILSGILSNALIILQLAMSTNSSI